MKSSTRIERLFVAIVPPPEVRDLLVRQQDLLKKSLQGSFSWVPAHNIHLTLKFLGDVPETAVPGIEAALTGAAGELQGFRLEVCGGGVFPHAGKPEIIWAGTGQGAGQAAGLAKRLNAVSALPGQLPETRPFRAHFTLGRVKAAPHPEVLRHTLKTLTYAPAAITITHISLVRSRLHPLGARYDVLDTFALYGK